MIVLWIKEIYDCTQKNMNYEITSDTDLKKFKELDQREILDRYIFNFEQKTWYIYKNIFKICFFKQEKTCAEVYINPIGKKRLNYVLTNFVSYMELSITKIHT
jgi:hypothetical protein